MDALAAIPTIKDAQSETQFNSQLNDLLMTVYLSNTTRSQLAIAERLQRVA